ncbi:MAG: MaoC/PaaZ C-terminal domain-containing protein [Acidimicrobiia bacterium]|nr:MaoC/PaaZ C-terminal domain-containing protein [Acidimicrobiia bacterium]
MRHRRSGDIMGDMLEPGTSLDVPLRFSQSQFDEFARLSGDDNPIHVDPEFCAGTRFGKPVAHGMMLFGMLDAAVCRWIDEPVALWAQELTFRAPTFADDDLTATLNVETANERHVRIAQWLHRSDGEETAGGHTVVGFTDAPHTADGVADPPPTADGELFGIRPGMDANAERTITAPDVDDYLELVDNPNPRYGAERTIPPPLLGGLVSHLLGVELPGRGTNWLRQRYTFHATVPVGSRIETRVEVTRVRPEKALVNLATTCTAAGRTAVTGDALVLIADLAR